VRTPIEAPVEVMVVPATALRRGADGDHVFAIVKNEQGALVADVRRVTSGASLGDVVVIKDGLKVGDRVAAAGSFKLIPGALIAVVDKAAAGKLVAAPQGTESAAGDSTAKPQ
jgi:membrane fusion protein (multidrug efflux system)